MGLLECSMRILTPGKWNIPWQNKRLPPSVEHFPWKIWIFISSFGSPAASENVYTSLKVWPQHFHFTGSTEVIREKVWKNQTSQSVPIIFNPNLEETAAFPHHLSWRQEIWNFLQCLQPHWDYVTWKTKLPVICLAKFPHYVEIRKKLSPWQASTLEPIVSFSSSFVIGSLREKQVR
jgi:hypothetical protein